MLYCLPPEEIAPVPLFQISGRYQENGYLQFTVKDGLVYIQLRKEESTAEDTYLILDLKNNAILQNSSIDLANGTTPTLWTLWVHMYIDCYAGRAIDRETGDDIFCQVGFDGDVMQQFPIDTFWNPGVGGYTLPDFREGDYAITGDTLFYLERALVAGGANSMTVGGPFVPESDRLRAVTAERPAQ